MGSRPHLMNEILDLLAQHRIVPSVALDDQKAAKPVSDAIIAGGLPIVEVTLRTSDSLSALERIINRRDMIVGAGTVTTLAQFDAAWRLGARFIVTPGLDESIIRHGRRRGLLVIPGAVTPTEVMQAQNLGVDLVKFFPCKAFGGTATLEMLAGPFPKMKFMAAGGLQIEDLQAYLKCPNVLACGGSWIAQREWIQTSSWNKIRIASTDTVKAVRATYGGAV
jgi:2-dehydro-3-deoxyphosphogluconate aldolase/(4S)-4-hydroxy-2-oxoglutarate aldolase